MTASSYGNLTPASAASPPNLALARPVAEGFPTAPDRATPRARDECSNALLRAIAIVRASYDRHLTDAPPFFAKSRNVVKIPHTAIGSYPPRAGNTVHPLIDGVPAFRRIAEAIEAANHSVWVTVAFIAPD